MARLIAIMGESGSGKTTAMRTLDPASTFYIDIDGKGLAWKGWRQQYNRDRKNYVVRRNIPEIAGILNGISANCHNIKTIVVDTLNTAMVDKEIKSMNEKGYDKWADLAQYVWNLIEAAAQLREDLTVIFTFHAETVRDDLGYSFTHIKTNGRKLEKLVLESLFSVVLLAKRDENGRYILETQSKASTAKSPMGALPETMDNDMGQVLAALADY
jgi:energy-coupling factor transporter ATP-binding protein EcfA2